MTVFAVLVLYNVIYRILYAVHDKVNDNGNVYIAELLIAGINIVLVTICILIGYFTNAMWPWTWVYVAIAGLAVVIVVCVFIYFLTYHNDYGKSVFDILLNITHLFVAFAVGISVCATMYIVERQPDGIYENFYYYINDDNMLTVSAYSYEESVEFPSEIDGRLVSTIAAPIYATGNKNLKSVVIPEGIIAIGSGVFKDTLVEKIDFPETLITIGANAFKNSTITEVVLPDSVTNVYEHAFENCNRLTTFHCGKNMSGVGKAAFKNCVALTDVYLNDDIENISTSAFENCNRLKELFVPEGLVSLGTDAFSGCSQLTVRFGREEHPGFWSGWSTTYGSVTEEWGAKR